MEIIMIMMIKSAMMTEVMNKILTIIIYVKSIMSILDITMLAVVLVLMSVGIIIILIFNWYYYHVW